MDGAGPWKDAWKNERPGFRHLVLVLFCRHSYVNKESHTVLLDTIGFIMRHIGSAKQHASVE